MLQSSVALLDLLAWMCRQATSAPSVRAQWQRVSQEWWRGWWPIRWHCRWTGPAAEGSTASVCWNFRQQYVVWKF